MAATTWAATLDEFAAFLNDAEEALATGEAQQAVVAWDPPAAPPVHPTAAERTRAHQLLAWAAHLRPRVEAQREVLRRELADVDRTRTASAAYAAH